MAILKKYTNFYFLFFFLCSSCQPNIDDLNVGLIENKIVIWSTLYADSVATAFISKTAAPLASYDEKKLPNALVLLFENERVVDTLYYQTGSRYQSKKNFKPTPSNVYKISAAKSGYPTAETFPDTMPTKPVLKDITTVYGYDKDSVGTIYLDIKTDFPKFLMPYLFDGTTESLDNLALSLSSLTIIGGNNCNFLFPPCIPIPVDRYRALAGITCNASKACKFKESIAITASTNFGFLAERNLASNAQNDSSNNADIFWSPVFQDLYVKNGYGLLTCKNILKFEKNF